jgi:pre-mRNA-splicing factor ISY1
LPGVRELFEQAPPEVQRKKRGELFTNIDADYYGYRDEEDGILLPLEAEAEQYAIAEAMAEWQAKQEGEVVEAFADEDDDDLYAEAAAADAAEQNEQEMELDDGDGEELAVHEEVPTQNDIAKLLLERKRELLLQQYASSELQAQGETAKMHAGQVL